MVLNQEQIKEIIPHRDPFLLIDEVTGLEPGVRAPWRRRRTRERSRFSRVSTRRGSEVRCSPGIPSS